jgi:hypothetical protein
LLGNIGTTSIEYSGNSLRYGLIDIKPIEIIETIKKAGIKFQRVIRKFESSHQPRTYGDMVSYQNDIIFSSIRVPDWFDAPELAKFVTKGAIESYEKDVEYKKAVEELKNNKSKSQHPLYSFVQFARARFESEMDSYLTQESERFMRSNLPLSFYNKLVIFDNTYRDFLTALEGIVRKYEFFAGYSRSFQMYGKHISEMKSAIGPIIDQVDLCALSYFRLKNYVAVWNAKDYSEVNNPYFLDMEKFDYAEFSKICEEYNNVLVQTRSQIFTLDQKISLNNLNVDNQARDMFTKLASLPSESWLNSS